MPGPAPETGPAPCELTPEQERDLALLSRTLLPYLTGRVKDAVVAQDLTGEVCVVVLSHLRAGEAQAEARPIDDIVAFGFAIARRLAKHHWSKQAERRMVSLEELTESGVELPAALSSPADELLQDLEEERAALRRCMQQLASAERQLLRQYYAAGKNKDNRARQAQALGLKEDALSQRASRLRRRVRVCAERALARPQRQQAGAAGTSMSTQA